MSVYSEFRFYSPIADAGMVRLSMCDARGGEFWMTIPDGAGKAYRKRREDALEALQAAVGQGLEPGRVTLGVEA